MSCEWGRGGGFATSPDPDWVCNVQTQTTPPPVLADALGLNPQTAIRHARRGSGQYGAYVADRIHADM